MEAAWQEDKNKREDGEPTEEPAGCEENRSIQHELGERRKKWENKLHVNKYSKHLPPTPVLPLDAATQTKCTVEQASPPPEPGLGTGASLRGKTDRSSQVNHRFLLNSH